MSGQMNATDDMPCRELVELVTAYLEQALPPDVHAAFEAHLEVCDGCRLYLGQMRLTVRALAHHHDGMLPPQLRARLLAHFGQWKAARA